MRWLFLLLLVLNGFYLVWNLQDAPVRAKDLGSISGGRSGDSGIKLLSETKQSGGGQAMCLFVGAFAEGKPAEALAQRLREAGLDSQRYTTTAAAGVEHWLRLPVPEQGADDTKAVQVGRIISGLRQQIIPCEGIATPE